MLQLVRKAIRGLAHSCGYDIVNLKCEHMQNGLPSDFRDEWRDILHRVRPFTMTSPERIYNLCLAVQYVCNHAVPGAFVECGVWKGGSIMTMALALIRYGEVERDIYLFDTFEGMPEPNDVDRTYTGITAKREFETQFGKAANIKYWAYSPRSEVAANVYSTGYSPDKFQFVEGRVEDTLPDRAPPRIALLRLDTDWYASTAVELEVLFPRLASGGVLMIDDYGTFSGAARAVDEYCTRNNIKILLTRIDAGLYMGIKQ